MTQALRGLALAALALGAVGCPGDVKGDEAVKKSEEKAMADGFDKARASFQAFAAGKLGVEAPFVVPQTEGVAKGYVGRFGGDPFSPHVGAAWAFEAAKPGGPGPLVRGWALPDGTVITREQHLGRLFEQAGLWTPTPTLAFPAVVERLIWSFGPPHVPTRRVPTSFALAPDGTGSGAFGTELVIPGGPTTLARFVVALGADHSATLAVAP